MHLLKNYKRLRTHRLCGSPVLMSGYILLLPWLKTLLPKITFSGKLADSLQIRGKQGPCWQRAHLYCLIFEWFRFQRSRDSDIKGKTLFCTFIVFPKIWYYSVNTLNCYISQLLIHNISAEIIQNFSEVEYKSLLKPPYCLVIDCQ